MKKLLFIGGVLYAIYNLLDYYFTSTAADDVEKSITYYDDY